MNFKQKLGYMFIGCLFTIAGYILASLGGITTHAQQDEQIMDKIICRELQVVNKDGQTVVNIGEHQDDRTREGGTREGGTIEVFNTAGKEVVDIGADEDGGGIVVRNAAEKGVAGILGTEDGGAIGVHNAAGKGVVGIVADEDGNGGIVVFNAAEKRVVGIVATEDGNGIIQTYDDGWRIH